MRRLQAALESLRASVRPEYVPAVDDELARLDATVRAEWAETVDADRSVVSDTQGIGGPERIAVATAAAAPHTGGAAAPAGGGPVGSG